MRVIAIPEDNVNNYFLLFLGDRNLTQSTRRSPREAERETTDGTDVEKMTKSEEPLPIESDERRETIGLSNLLPPPCSIRDVRVIRGYFLYAGTSGSSGGEQTFNHGFHGCRPESGTRGSRNCIFRGKDGLAASDLAGALRFIDCGRRLLLVHSHSRGITARPSSSQPAKSDLSQRSLPRCC